MEHYLLLFFLLEATLLSPLLLRMQRFLKVAYLCFESQSFKKYLLIIEVTSNA